MRKTNSKKIERAKTLLSEGKTYEEIREVIKKEFEGEGISNSTLSQLKKDKLDKKIDNNVKDSIQILIDLFTKSLELKEFRNSITDPQIKAMNLLEELF